MFNRSFNIMNVPTLLYLLLQSDFNLHSWDMAPLVHRQSNPKNERHIEGTVIILFNKSKVVIVQANIFFLVKMQANMIRVKIVKQARESSGSRRVDPCCTNRILLSENLNQLRTAFGISMFNFAKTVVAKRQEAANRPSFWLLTWTACFATGVHTWKPTHFGVA